MSDPRVIMPGRKQQIYRANQQRTSTMKKLILALMTTAAAIGFAASAQAQEKLKACWVYVGPVGDFGYSYQHDQGRLQVEKELGDKVETAFLENVAEGP